MNKMTSVTALYAALALLLAGCSLAPRYERPAVPLAAGYPRGAQPVNAPQAAVAELGWKQVFPDARLQRLIQIALDNNQDLQLAALNVRRAQVQFRIERAAQWPTLNAALRQSKERPEVSGDIAAYGVGITAYELDLFGRIQSLKEAALASYLGTQASRKTVQIGLVAAVASGYLTLLADDSLYDVAWQTVQSRSASLSLIQLRHANGIGTETDLRQAEGLLENARASLAQYERQRAQDLNALVLLLGVPSWPADLAQGDGALPALDGFLADLPAGLPSALLTHRPDIEAAEHRLMAANADIGAARAAFFPRVELTGSFGRASTGLSNLFNEATRAWSFTPQITVPIFDFGANQANLDAAKVDREIATAQYRKTIQVAFSEVADALAGSATWKEQLRATQAQAQSARAAFALLDLRYRNGGVDYLAVMDAQRTLFEAEQALVQVRMAALHNRITLYKVLGGGWSAETVRLAAHDRYGAAQGRTSAGSGLSTSSFSAAASPTRQ
ncbi:efflux transporter outer membrane subunit [Cupriavidus basilensis]|uniref:Efflux transporter outer membrane subunit n=1 Tax=Cupriavidus basilensis TaxID=68895 RepID=A0ABT6ATC2_9BURK|nr:efflux transporter outer membrane subunit [Cupriavidus basilensis]MDF3835874.1 efflux transporter outer membrane subunit [Cupriavidus basilensis]